MKTFIVQLSAKTFYEVEVDSSLYERYKDMSTEAMALALEKLFKANDSSDELSYIIIAYEKGGEDDPNKHIVCLTSHVLRNIGYHDLAEECQNHVKGLIDNG